MDEKQLERLNKELIETKDVLEDEQNPENAHQAENGSVNTD